MSDHTITRKTVESYQIRTSKGEGWADITLDTLPGQKSGRIQIASDFGDWQNYWGACGSSFKEFLIGLDAHYVAGKFGANKYFDFDATLKAVKKESEECKTNKNYSDLLADIKEIEDTCGPHKDEFVHMVMNSNLIMQMYDGGPDLVYDLDPGFKRFWNEAWPVFITELKKEIAETVPA